MAIGGRQTAVGDRARQPSLSLEVMRVVAPRLRPGALAKQPLARLVVVQERKRNETDGPQVDQGCFPDLERSILLKRVWQSPLPTVSTGATRMYGCIRKANYPVKEKNEHGCGDDRSRCLASLQEASSVRARSIVISPIDGKSAPGGGPRPMAGFTFANDGLRRLHLPAWGRPLRTLGFRARIAEAGRGRKVLARLEAP